jgi:phospholipase C
MFVHTATTQGYNGGNYYNYPLQTPSIFESLQQANHSWGLYYHDFTTAHGISPLNTYTNNFHQDDQFQNFFSKLQNNQLEDYSFLVPLLNPASYDPVANTQHPSYDIRAGEWVIKRVYETLRSSSYWTNTLLVLTYDEHGGFWDKVSPPNVWIPNPSPSASSHPYAFGFDRLGVRIPTILISPYLASTTDDTVYDHASVVASLRYIFNISTPLSHRDQYANIFNKGILSSPRHDTPVLLPNPPTDIPLCSPSDDAIMGLQDEMTFMYDDLLQKKGITIEMKLKDVKTARNAAEFNRQAIRALFG